MQTNFRADFAWAPSILPKSYVASLSQDKMVTIWTPTTSVDSGSAQLAKKALQFDSVDGGLADL